MPVADAHSSMSERGGILADSVRGYSFTRLLVDNKNDAGIKGTIARNLFRDKRSPCR